MRSTRIEGAGTAEASTSVLIGRFDNSYARLPEPFHVRLPPSPVSAPRLLAFNQPLADELGLDVAGITDEALAELFAGNTLPEGADPIALAYAGHQFGHFVPQLGDGRAVLLGEVVDRSGQRRDLQLKGAGRTPFSRGGDGRAALGPVLREYLVSEAMHAMGVPTTRALAAVASGDRVLRERPLPGAVLTRVAASHLRVGTFQYFAARGDEAALRQLLDYTIDRHYPDLNGHEVPALGLLEAVQDRQARLVAHWMRLGFIHGVMNTDNCSLSGETIDYGPCAFMDSYDPDTVFSSVDTMGRYAYRNQPTIAQWNLARLAECLLPLIDPDEDRAVAMATDCLERFPGQFRGHWLTAMAAKLGIHAPTDADRALIDDLLQLMHGQGADFTLTFRALTEDAAGDGSVATAAALFADSGGFRRWADRWWARMTEQPDGPPAAVGLMRACNPAVIPRNHRVEQAIAAAVDHADLQPFEALLEAVLHPFEDREQSRPYMTGPAPEERVLQTFCGT